MKDKRTVTGLLTLVAFISLVMVSGALAAPKLIRYEGTLTNAYGDPIPDQTLSLRFRICTAETSGNVLWKEVQKVEVKNGKYSVLLGSVTPFPASLFLTNKPRWLEVKAGADAPFPRELMVSVAYALNAESLDGLDSKKFSPSSHTHDLSTLKGSLLDAQVPDNITIKHAATAGSAASALTAGFATSAGDADTVDGKHAAAFASSNHSHDTRYYTKAEVDALTARIASLETAVAKLQTVLANVTRSGNELTFSGMNVRIVNGTGATNTSNGTGNLLVGYNEVRGDSGDVRTGSHNLIVGRRHNYSSYGGIVTGYWNSISAPYASVSGGRYNLASGESSSVSGGYSNQATASYASVSGGAANTASGINASVSGGRYNIASGESSSVSGGGGISAEYGNQAFGDYTSILGGETNIAGDPNLSNHSIGPRASVSGGTGNKATGPSASVSGGWNNTASGGKASVSGGYYNTANGPRASVSGGWNNTASNSEASVSGGYYNRASASQASVSGGYNHAATGDYDWRAGTYYSDF